MTEKVQENIKKILLGELEYRSSNLALNMLITKLKRKLQIDPDSMDDCMQEIETFSAKSPIIAKVDFANIAAL